MHDDHECALPVAPRQLWQTQRPTTLRPDHWAQRVVVGNEIPNLHRVNANLYRSAQPTKAGFRLLAARTGVSHGDQPVRTVLSLRAVNGDERSRAPGSPVQLQQIKFDARWPEDQDVIQFLDIVTSPRMQPVLVHCQRGADRTGTMMAIYRMAIENWTAAQALREMSDGGFGFNPLYQHLLHYVRDMNIKALRLQLTRQRAGQ